MPKLRIGGAALNQTPLDWKGNFENIVNAINEAKKQNVDVLCLPELCIPGYGCEDLFNHQWLIERSVIQLQKIIPYCINITVAMGLPIVFENKTYNCACMIKDGRILGISAKQHLANGGVYYETRWFTPWPKEKVAQIEIDNNYYDIGDIIYEIDVIKIGFEICEDAWIKDRPACRLVEKNVDLILNPSGSHFAFEKSIERQKLVIDSSKKFNCAYLYVNLLGNEAGEIIYDGEILLARNGQYLSKNRTFQFVNYSIISNDIDFTKSVAENTIETEYLPRNEQFARAVSLGLFDYLRKSHSQGFVISLSGGADSSCCAILVAEMIKRGVNELGTKEFVSKAGLSLDEEHLEELTIKQLTSKILTCAYQATENSSSQTLESARNLAKEIGAQFFHWDINDAVNVFNTIIEKALNQKLTWEKDDITLQNIQARTRSPLIWMLANIKNSLLLTTSNRSETDVGYATMDGDTSGSLAPVAGISKTFLRNWLKWAQNELGYHCLEDVNKLTPTAELRPSERHQTDETDLMPYPLLEKIERLAIWERKSPAQIYVTLNNQQIEAPEILAKHIDKFFTLLARNQWKRERMAPSFQLDDFNINPRSWFRFPILSAGFLEELEELRKNVKEQL